VTDKFEDQAIQADKSVDEPAKPSDDFDPQPHIQALKPFVDRFRRGLMDDDRLFESVVRSSLAKCFDYVLFAYSAGLTAENAFFCTGTLRSICEDLIILRYLGGWNSADRNRVIRLDMELGVDDQVARQEAFFSRFRYGQPVLAGSIGPQRLRAKIAERYELWRRNGFPNEKRGQPITEQIAKKLGAGTFDVLYDYIFRLTSGTVHFNVRALLRTGWGNEVESEGMNVAFSPTNMGLYEKAFCEVYSAFLLTIYFEFFPEVLAAPTLVLQQVKKLRRALTMMTRWPEIVTFEEMNRPIPKGSEILNLMLRIVAAGTFEDGFIAGAQSVHSTRPR
jgi:hypothetical protein